MVNRILKTCIALIQTILLLCICIGWAAADADYLWPIRVGGLWGYMNSNGETAIPADYLAVELFSDGRAIVHTQDGDGLIDTDGRYLITPQPDLEIEEYDHAYRIIDKANDAEGFFDKQSCFFQTPNKEYYLVMLWGDDGSGPIAVQNTDGLTGYISRTNGSIAIPFQYTGESEHPAFSEGYALAANILILPEGEDEWHEIRPDEAISNDELFEAYDGMGSRQYLIDTNGDRVAFPEGVRPESGVSNGVLIVSFMKNDAFEYLNEEEWEEEGSYTFRHLGIARPDGSIVLDTEDYWYMWQPDEEGMICVLRDEGWLSFCGHMDREGHVIVPAMYPISTGGEIPGYCFHNGYAVFPVDREGKEYIIVLRADGTVIAELADERENWYWDAHDVMDNRRIWVESWHVASAEVVNNFFQVETDNKTIKLYSVENDEFDIVSERSYDSVKAGIRGIPCRMDEFSEGLQAVQVNGLWGFIDKDGTEMIPFMWDAAGNFDHGLALVQKDDNLLYIDHTGAVVWEEEQ